MNYFLRFVIALFTFASSATLATVWHAHGPSNTSHHALERQALNLTHQWHKALLQRDVSAMERILADDYVLEGTVGAVRNKAMLIEDMTDSSIVVTASPINNEIEVEVAGDSVILTDQAIVVAMPQGAKSDMSRVPCFSVRNVYEERQGRLQLVHTKASTMECRY